MNKNLKIIQSLEKWWWSPAHPTTYIAKHPEGHPCGIGLLLKNDPMAAKSEISHWHCFNLVWSKYGESLKTWDGASAGVSYSIALRKFLEKPALGGTLADLACLYSQEDFMAYCKANRIKIDVHHLQRV